MVKGRPRPQDVYKAIVNPGYWMISVVWKEHPNLKIVQGHQINCDWPPDPETVLNHLWDVQLGDVDGPRWRRGDTQSKVPHTLAHLLTETKLPIKKTKCPFQSFSGNVQTVAWAFQNTKKVRYTHTTIKDFSQVLRLHSPSYGTKVWICSSWKNNCHGVITQLQTSLSPVTRHSALPALTKTAGR